MTKEQFDTCLRAQAAALSEIKKRAHELHASVNQQYDGQPYSIHLDMVAQGVSDYGHEVCQRETDVLPLFFGAWFHDSIEDARQTYNDIQKTARSLGLDEEQAYMAAEIVYALTNDKGRTRAERAGEQYYAGIRETPYAPFIKLCDRMANMSYSFTHDNESNMAMRRIYSRELPHFLASIDAGSSDSRLSLPSDMVACLKGMAE